MRKFFQILAIFGLFWCLLADEEENPEPDGESSDDPITIKIGE